MKLSSLNGDEAAVAAGFAEGAAVGVAEGAGEAVAAGKGVRTAGAVDGALFKGWIGPAMQAESTIVRNANAGATRRNFICFHRFLYNQTRMYIFIIYIRYVFNTLI